ncbi:hypothetical protein AUI06_10785 [archaeon 13_2_20CM_2_52_21]|nr:MAG: hypothetical protein AUI06_10785 [archaeon 13_2_20CM_2_52_21]OLD44037.1 MAG: hypothetical protein AUI51_04135 [archaeon 13_1_40CM_2_52_4]
MPLKIIHPYHTEIMGRGLVLLSNPQIAWAKRDLYTGQIVEEAALLSKSWAIIAKESKQLQGEAEARLAMSDSDKSVRDFVDEYGVKCLIAISGTAGSGITVKSHADDSESEEVLDIIKSGFEPHFNVNLDADQSRNKLSNSRTNNGRDDGSSSHPVNTVQIELGPEERSFRKDQIVNSLADIVSLINAKLGFSESSSSVLD